jgi:hypothetical protein
MTVRTDHVVDGIRNAVTVLVEFGFHFVRQAVCEWKMKNNSKSMS